MPVPTGSALIAAWSVPASAMTIAICQIIGLVLFFVGIAAIIYAIFAFKAMINNKVDEAMSKIQPVVDQAKSIAEQAKHTAETVSAKVDSIASKAEDTANRVGDRVQSVSERVEEAINPQVVTAAGIVGTAARCVQIYKDLVQLKQGNGGPKQL